MMILHSKALLGATLALALTGLAAQAETHLRYGTSSAAMVAAPLLLGTVDTSIFTDNGLTVDMTDFRGQTANCVVAVVSEAVDLCQVGTLSATDAVAEGADLVAIAATNAMTAELIISAHAMARLGVAVDAPIAERIAALQGLRISSSAPGTGHYLVMGEILGAAGLDIGDIQYQVLGDTAAMMESLRNDRLDAVLWSIGGLGPVIADGSGARWISPRTDMPALRDLPYYVVYARRDWVDANPETVAAVRASLTTAIDRLIADPDTTGALVKQAYFPDMEQAIWDDSFAENVKTLLPGATISRAGWDSYINLYAATSDKDYSNITFENIVIPDAREE